MMDWSTKTLAVDIAYCNSVNDYKQFVENGVQIAFIKLSQGKAIHDKYFDTHWKKCREAGLKVGAYHIFDPRANPIDQLSWIRSNYPASEADFPLTIDCEDLPGLRMSTFSRSFLISQIGNLWGLLTREYGKKPIIYTGPWWWNQYIVPFPAWAKEADFWLASYPFKKGKVTVTWEEFRTRWLSKVNYWVQPVKGGPEPAWWQISGDKFCVPGVNGAIDIDVFNGTLEECYQRYGIENKNDDYKGAIDYKSYISYAKPFLNIRRGPGMEYADIGDLLPNIPVTVFDEKNDWAKIDPVAEKWVYKAYLVEVNL